MSSKLENIQTIAMVLMCLAVWGLLDQKGEVIAELERTRAEITKQCPVVLPEGVESVKYKF